VRSDIDLFINLIKNSSISDFALEELKKEYEILERFLLNIDEASSKTEMNIDYNFSKNSFVIINDLQVS